MDILERTFGDNVSFTMDTTTAAPGNADAFVPQLQCSRGGVRGLARTGGISFPLRHRPRPDPGPCGCRLAGRELSRVSKRVAERLAITETAGLEV